MMQNLAAPAALGVAKILLVAWGGWRVLYRIQRIIVLLATSSVVATSASSSTVCCNGP